MTNWVGYQFGNYQLTHLLGEGAFAKVYLGQHIHLGTQAAIKVLDTQLTSDDLEKFRTEARTIARLIHPNIVRVLEFGIEDRTSFLVMDYAPNGTLRQRHPKGQPVPLATLVSYVKQIADALQYAHDAKLIHRDIKPENILLGRNGELLLSDFGVALTTQTSRSQSIQEGIAGTVTYMAPEQLQGKPQFASDQYSLGILLYEWLCGEAPFKGLLTEIYCQHISVAPPSLRIKVPSLPPQVEQVVLTALEKDPSRRFPSMKALSSALEQASFSAQISNIDILKPFSQKGQPIILRDAQRNVDLSQHSSQTTFMAPQSPLPKTRRASVGKTLLLASFILLIVLGGAAFAMVQANSNVNPHIAAKPIVQHVPTLTPKPTPTPTQVPPAQATLPGVALPISSVANHLYISAELSYSGNNSGMLRARAPQAGPWEQFYLKSSGPGGCDSLIELQSAANGLYVSAELGYTGANYGMLRARASRIGSWEQFYLRCLPNGIVAFQSAANGLYVSAELSYTSGNTAMLRARASRIGSWEQFSY